MARGTDPELFALFGSMAFTHDCQHKDKDKLNHSVWKSGLSSIIHVHIHMIIIRKAQTETKKNQFIF